MGAEVAFGSGTVGAVVGKKVGDRVGEWVGLVGGGVGDLVGFTEKVGAFVAISSLPHAQRRQWFGSRGTWPHDATASPAFEVYHTSPVALCE